VSWNYRVIKHTSRPFSHQIHEVYYDRGNIHSCSTDPIVPYGETVEELQEDIRLMQAAFEKPAILYEDIGKGEYWDEDEDADDGQPDEAQEWADFDPDC